MDPTRRLLCVTIQENCVGCELLAKECSLEFLFVDYDYIALLASNEPIYMLELEPVTRSCEMSA